ncbi:hypothetical protein BCV70DRAFT_207751 [Testicularia cyperi]|uniref:1-alkyl-2-acetylglycerophosphocholine esterase n=1 Tax=Testicularia cyperi TaxID=1882483 RepID=A0A317XMI5_9BASI|nr:hypothetical protein BCV70DRAFT_207751 [Testicularia cyperi]
MSLPPPSSKARYAVSTITLEVPLDEPIQQNSSSPYTYNDGGVTRQVLTTDTVLLTMYYPTDKDVEGGSSSTVSAAATGSVPEWLEAPKLKSLGGLLKYAGIPKYLAVPIIIPAYSVIYQKLPVLADAPIASSPSGINAERGFPVAVMSHGLGGSRTTYSAYCSSLAASGIVVAAVEHRDGSCALTVIHHPPASSSTANGSAAHSSGLFGWLTGSGGKDEHGTIEPKIYIKPAEIDGQPAPMTFRRAQVEMRRQEVLAALDVVKGIANGKGAPLIQTCTRTCREKAAVRNNRAAVLSAFAGKLDVSNPWLIGHSFGGCTAIESLRRSDCPFGRALTLDPWVEPIAVTGSDTTPVSKPLYVINSEDFTQWKSHMDDVSTISKESRAVTGGKGWVMTLGAEGTEKDDDLTAAVIGTPGPPSRLVIVHDMFGTLFGLDACIDALVSLFEDQLRASDSLPPIVPELIVMDWFHATQRDFTYSSVGGEYKPIAQVFKGTLPRVLLQAGILPAKSKADAKPLTKAGSYVDDGPAEEALESPFDASVVDTMMGALKQLRPRPGMVDALTRIYRDRDGKGRIPASVDKIDVWAATNGSLELGRASFLRALGEIDGADLDSSASQQGKNDQERSIGTGIGLFSCDEIGVAKPDPKVYAEILRRIRAEPVDPNGAIKEFQGIWFVASHTWDTFAAKRAGFRTAWVTYEEHFPCQSVYGTPDVVGRDMAEVAEKILAYERKLQAGDAAAKAAPAWTYSKENQSQGGGPVASQHTSFSDFPFLLPSMSKFIGSVSSQSLLEINSQVTQRMILGDRCETHEGVFSGLQADGEQQSWRVWTEGRPRPAASLDAEKPIEGKGRKGRIIVHAT